MSTSYYYPYYVHTNLHSTYNYVHTHHLLVLCQTYLSNHIEASLTRIKYDDKTQQPQLTAISESTSVSDDNYDGPFDGDMIPNDEDHGICTQDNMLLDGLEMAPANFVLEFHR